MPAHNPIYAALDRPDLEGALAIARSVRDLVGGFKVGLELVMAEGPRAIGAINALGLPVFVDVKLHDIPNTVAGALRSLARARPALITVHAAGGRAMLEAAAAAVRDLPDRPRLLGVTVLTSLDARDLADTGVGAAPDEQAVRLARLAADCSIDGIVCAPQEIGAIRRAIGPTRLIVVPGIRPAGAAADDQKRVMTPAQALAAGADILVVGRPINAASDPASAARSLLAELPRAA